jgi:hypothetical protein
MFKLILFKGISINPSLKFNHSLNKKTLIHTNIIYPEEQLNDYLNEEEESILLLIKIEEFKYIKYSYNEATIRNLQQLFAIELLKYMPQECNFSKIYLLNNGKFAFVKKYNSFIDEESMSKSLQSFQSIVNQKKN